MVLCEGKVQIVLLCLCSDYISPLSHCVHDQLTLVCQPRG